MNKIFSLINQFFYNLPDRMIKQRWLVLALTLVGTAIMVVGIATRFTFDPSTEGMFDDSDPAQQALDEFRSQFGSDESVFVVYQPKDGDVFSQQSLSTMRQLTNELEAAIDKGDIARAIEVNTLTNASASLDVNGSLIVQDLVPNPIPADTSAIRQLAMAQPGLALMLYSEDHKFGAFTLKTDYGTIPKESTETAISDDMFADFSLEMDTGAEVRAVDFVAEDYLAYPQTSKDLQAILMQPDYQDFTFYESGMPALMKSSLQVMTQGGILVMIMLVLIIGLLWWLLRTASAVAWPILAIVLSTVWAMGLASWIGIQMTTMIVLAIMLILAVGIADCVHVMSAYLYYRREGEDHAQSMRHAWGKTGLAIVLTTITTATGMFALSLSGISLFVEFGILGALGVAMALVFTAFLLPVLMHWWHPAKSVKNAEHGKIQALLDRVPNASKRHPWLWVVGFAIVFVISILGAMQTRVDSNMLELFRDGSPIIETYNVIDDNMAGTSNMIVMVNTQTSDGLKDPIVLQAMANLQEVLQQGYPELVTTTYSLANIVQFNNDLIAGSGEVIPKDPRATSQLLYLFDSSDPEARRQLVSDDYSRSYISVSMRNASSADYAQLSAELDSVIEQTFAPVFAKYPQASIETTGSFAMMMTLTQTLSDVQYRGLILAMVLITAVMIISMGSIQAGLIGMIPNLIPALSIFGIAGWFDIALDADTLMIVPIIIGIAVDDTIHFITHYRNLLLQGEEEETALSHTIKEVGQAVSFTTIILGVSFAILVFSIYLGLVKIGGFAAVALFIALANDLFLIPALIRIFKPRFGVKKTSGATAS